MLAADPSGYDVVQIHITTLLDWRVSGIKYGKFQAWLKATLITLAPHGAHVADRELTTN